MGMVTANRSGERLGDVCLDGVLALLQSCILDADGLGDEFRPKQWQCLAEVVELPIIAYEVKRLSDGPAVKELQELLERYYGHCFGDIRAELTGPSAAASIDEIMGALPDAVATPPDRTPFARTAGSGRLGERCLRGLVALLTACLRDAESLKSRFRAIEWRVLDKVIASDIIRFELDRLGDDEYEAFRELALCYRQLVFPKRYRSKRSMPFRFRLPPRLPAMPAENSNERGEDEQRAA
jgi:hypothetical protein